MDKELKANAEALKRAVGELREADLLHKTQAAVVQDRVKKLASEMLYQNGRVVEGVSIRFLAQLHVLEYVCGLRSASDLFTQDSMKLLGESTARLVTNDNALDGREGGKV